MSDPITSPAEDGAGRETLLNQALDAAYHEARSLAEQAGIRWKDAKRIADVYYGPAIKNDVEQISAAESRAAAAEAEVARLRDTNARLLIAFHDATRRPLGVTPDSGAEFYDQRMADEAEDRVRIARAGGRHRFKPHKLYPQFCECGYPESTSLIHLPRKCAALTGGSPDAQA